ncbi:hypothetical protein [Erwinia sp. 198]|uniref:hypothetical protein n=1 Tax=Erwinia sp. 198 TaxID=2022746 RepID=UPI000F68D38C|nr:hypothetical protein [Erwinia sp. 198]RRZ90976.1 hypothetical protein EGK14_13205 [Erwinia sp. 198]
MSAQAATAWVLVNVMQGVRAIRQPEIPNWTGHFIQNQPFFLKDIISAGIDFPDVAKAFTVGIG